MPVTVTTSLKVRATLTLSPATKVLSVALALPLLSVACSSTLVTVGATVSTEPERVLVILASVSAPSALKLPATSENLLLATLTLAAPVVLMPGKNVAFHTLASLVGAKELRLPPVTLTEFKPNESPGASVKVKVISRVSPDLTLDKLPVMATSGFTVSIEKP